MGNLPANTGECGVFFGKTDKRSKGWYWIDASNREKSAITGPFETKEQAIENAIRSIAARQVRLQTGVDVNARRTPGVEELATRERPAAWGATPSEWSSRSCSKRIGAVFGQCRRENQCARRVPSMVRGR
jgi:hypothetical protein